MSKALLEIQNLDMLCALTDYYLFENVMAIKPMLD